MKGFTGLVIAGILGLAGAICNWLYLQQATDSLERVSFIAIKDGVTLNIGDLIQEEHLQKVDFPRGGVGHLDSVAPQWSARAAVIGQRANHLYSGGDLILEMDLQTPAQQQLAKTLQPNEVAFWVPIDPRSVVAEQINPGDLVSFEIAGSNKSPGQILGPFRVMAIGNRREPINVQQAFRGRTGSETTLTIVAQLKDGQLDPLTSQLSQELSRQNRQGLSVLLHSAKLPVP